MTRDRISPAWLRRWWPRSFRYRLLIGMVLSLGLAMLLFVSHVVLQQREHLMQQSEDKGRILAQALAVSNLADVLESDVQSMEELLRSLAGYPDLRYAMVLTPKGRILAHTAPALVGQYVSDASSRRWLTGPSRPVTLVRSTRLIDVAAPILAQERLVGWVRVGLGQETTAASLRAIMRDGALFTALALGLAALAAFLASRGLTRGLDRLVALTRETGPGAVAAVPSAPALDELSELGRTFDRLTQDLDQRVRDLQDRERFLHDLMEHLPVAVLVHGPDGAIRYSNPAALALTGVSPERILGETLSGLAGTLLREDGRPLPAEENPVDLVRRERRSYRNGVIGFCKEDGSPPRWLHLDAFPELDSEGKARQIVVAMVDVTERQEGRNELRKALADLEDLYQNAPCGYHSLGPDCTILRINDTELRWLGYTREELVGRKAFLDLLAPYSRPVFLENFAEFKQQGWVHDLEFDMVRKDGTRLSVLLNATAIQGPDGAYLYNRSSLTDVTLRMQAERALRASQYSLSQAQRIAHVGNWDLDLVHNVLTWSDEIYRIFEVDPATFGPSYDAFLEAIHPEDRERVDQAYRDSLRNREPYDIVHRLKMPDGRIKYVHELCESNFGPKGQPLRSRGTVQDITEHEVAEQEHGKLVTEVHHFQRLDSLGNLAGGVAHDMNNILAVVMNLAELHLERLPGSDPSAHAFDIIKKACTRGADLVHRLTQFARKQMENAEPLDLNATVREQVDLLERTTLKKAEWITDLEDPLPLVMGQASEIDNAIINLCINALDAIPRGGRITLRTRCLAGGGVEVIVEDNGTGMPPEVLARALDPYFTTKPAGKGTGLGLATVYGTMKAHGGSVEIQSEVGVGTTVHLRFPPTGARAEEAPAARIPAAEIPPIRVLLVDDDELIRLTLPPLLQRIGLTVEIAESGFQALEMLESMGPVDLVILDQNMPVLTGVETLARIRVTQPDLPVLLASGYGESDQSALPAVDPQVARLGKPYSLESLRGAISGLLATSQAGVDRAP